MLLVFKAELAQGIVRRWRRCYNNKVYGRVGEHLLRALVGFGFGMVFGGIVVRLGVSLDNGVQVEGGGEGEDEGDVKDWECKLATVIHLGPQRGILFADRP